MWRLSASYRNRIELREFKDRSSVVRYRTRLNVIERRGRTQFSARGYGSAEWFWQEGSTNPEGNDRIRVTLGFRKNPEDAIDHFVVEDFGSLRYVRADLYATYEWNYGKAGVDSVILGLKLGVFL